MPGIKNLAFAPLRSFICWATPIVEQERAEMIKRRVGPLAFVSWGEVYTDFRDAGSDTDVVR